MGKDPAMPMYCNDWLSSPTVMTMTPLEEVTFFRLCMFCWMSGDLSIPNDLEKLSVLARTDVHVCSNVVDLCFIEHPEKPGFLTNEKLSEVWENKRKYIQQKRDAGVNSGISRRNKANGRSNDKTTSVGVSFEPSSSAPSSAPSSSNPPYSPPQGDRSFQIFWNSFPKIGARKPATTKREFWKQVEKLKSEGVNDAEEFLISKAVEYRNSAEGKSIHCKHSSTWLHSEDYLADPAAWNRETDEARRSEVEAEFLKGED